MLLCFSYWREGFCPSIGAGGILSGGYDLGDFLSVSSQRALVIGLSTSAKAKFTVAHK